MSHFGNSEKDEVVDVIKALADSEREKGKTPREITVSIMEAVTYGLDHVLYDLKDFKVDSK